MAGNIWLELRFGKDADINDKNLMPSPLDFPGDKSVFLAFGVHRAEDCDHCHNIMEPYQERRAAFKVVVAYSDCSSSKEEPKGDLLDPAKNRVGDSHLNWDPNCEETLNYQL